MKEKVFNLGLHKTGTLSMHNALIELGYNSIHGTKKNSDLIIQSIFKKEDPLKQLHEKYKQLGKKVPFNAFNDLYAVIDHFVLLDRTYPDSKFILTTRDEDGWINSVQKQIEKRHDTPYYHYWYFQSPLQWSARKFMHENAVKQHFSGIPNKLLIFDATKGDGYEKLCKFLELPVLDKPYPHKNKSL